MAFGDKSSNGLLLERMSVAQRLWSAGIRAEFSPKVKPKLPQQFKAAEGVPLGVILGQTELDAGQVQLKLLGEERTRGMISLRKRMMESWYHWMNWPMKSKNYLSSGRDEVEK